MASLFAALMFLIPLVMDRTEIKIVPGEIVDQVIVETGEYIIARGVTVCYSDGRAVVYVPERVGMDSFVHELAHAYDCTDDGVPNSSPLPADAITATYPEPQRTACAHVRE